MDQGLPPPASQSRSLPPSLGPSGCDHRSRRHRQDRAQRTITRNGRAPRRRGADDRAPPTTMPSAMKPPRQGWRCDAQQVDLPLGLPVVARWLPTRPREDGGYEVRVYARASWPPRCSAKVGRIRLTLGKSPLDGRVVRFPVRVHEVEALHPLESARVGTATGARPLLTEVTWALLPTCCPP